MKTVSAQEMQYAVRRLAHKSIRGNAFYPRLLQYLVDAKKEDRRPYTSHARGEAG